MNYAKVNKIVRIIIIFVGNFKHYGKYQLERLNIIK